MSYYKDTKCTCKLWISGFVVLEPGVEFMSVDNLPKVVSVSCCTNMFSYEICDSVIDTRNVPAVVHAKTTTTLVNPFDAQNNDTTRKYMHAETLALLTKPLYFPNMKYLKYT
jgi:hypothetical protein